MTGIEIATILGLLVVPIVAANSAVIVTRYLDKSRDARSRRLDVFRILMRTRRMPTSVDHVGALNLIEIEFANDQRVLAAWKDLFRHFAASHGRRPEETSLEGLTTQQKQTRDEAFFKRLFDERQRLLAKLLHAMATSLGFRIEQLEIFEGGYTPQGWHDEATEQASVRRFLVDLYAARVALPVIVFNAGDTAHVVPSKEGDQAKAAEKGARKARSAL